MEFMSTTLIILKPDCLEQKHVGNVFDRFEKAGFEIVGTKMIRLTPELLRSHYAHVASKPFYPEIEAFMSSRPVIVVALKMSSPRSAICSVRPIRKRPPTELFVAILEPT